MRTALLFSAFEAVMPLIGIAVGRELGNAIGGAAVYAAIGLLFALAIYSLVADEDELESPFGRGLLPSVTLALSISLDELTIGVAFGLLRVPLVPVVALIALQAFVLSQVGMRAGGGIGRRVREAAEHLSGVVLAMVAIGLDRPVRGLGETAIRRRTGRGRCCTSQTTSRPSPGSTAGRRGR